jgi:hypothetical protein
LVVELEAGGLGFANRGRGLAAVREVRVAGIPRHISPHSLRHPAITNALDAGVPLQDAQILARHADPRTTEHYDRARKPRPARRPSPHRLRRRRATHPVRRVEEPVNRSGALDVFEVRDVANRR